MISVMISWLNHQTQIFAPVVGPSFGNLFMTVTRFQNCYTVVQRTEDVKESPLFTNSIIIIVPEFEMIYSFPNFQIYQ